MSFPAEITFTDGTNANVVSTISTKDGETIRRDASQGLSLPYVVKIGTTTSGNGKSKTYRHLVRIDETVNYDAEDPLAKIAQAVYFNIVRPEVITSTTGILILVAQLKAFLTPENVAKLLNGES